MQTRLLLRTITIFTGFFVLAGCNSEGTKSPGPAASAGSTQTDSKPPKGGTPNTQAPPAVARPDLKVVLQEAATKPTLPLEGEGWQPMFDGKTIAGWRETEFAGH